MIDQLARALMRFDGYDPNNSIHWQARGDHYRRTIDLLLTEMATLEPTDHMAMEFGFVMTTTDGRIGDVWPAMIKAARQS